MDKLMQGLIVGLAILALFAVPQPETYAAELPPGTTAARAEVQIGLCAPTDLIVKALHLRPKGAPIEVWQFDDSALTLFASGLRLRLRVAADGRSELTLKVAKQNCASLDPKVVPPGEGKCEYDVYGTSSDGAVSLNRSLGAKITHDLLGGRQTPEEVLSQAQIRYLRDVVGIWPLPPGIHGIGPMRVQTYRTGDKHYDIDISQLHAGEQYGEISRKVPLQEATQAMAAMEAVLRQAGVDMCSDQSSPAADKLRSLLR